MTDQDEALLTDLQVAARRHHDRVPGLVVAAARAAFTWRTVDAELALLAFDSATEDVALAGIRGGDARLLTFEAPGVVLDLEVSATGSTRRIVGQAVPALAQLELQRPDGRSAVEVDASGRFSFDGATPGPLRFRCLLPAASGGPRIVGTEWVSI